MATTQNMIREWFIRGKKMHATHLIVVCDTFEWEDYPVFVTKKQNVHEVYTEHNGSNMQKVMEVYNLSMDMEKQLAEHRAFHF
ncbi:MAG: hypothetical protein WC797_00990 [Candidatus Paceibacterota bacterium]